MSQPPPIPITRPWFDAREEEAVLRPLRAGWVLQGPEVAAFEAEFAAFTGAPLACAVSSGTAALHLALRAVGVQPGDEVITVSHSWIATANAVRYCGAVPVFVDIEPHTYNLDPTRVERLVSPRTRAILAVHQLGMPCDLAALQEIARRRGLRLVEDAACALGSEIALTDGAWEPIGRPHSDAACFSFHPRKLLTTGDGGMVTTADPQLDAAMRRWRNHSIQLPVEPPPEGALAHTYFPDLGYNYRLTDLQAALGRVQLERIPEMVAARRRQALRYHQLLAPLAQAGLLTLPHQPDFARSNWQSYAVLLHEDVDRDAVILHMQSVHNVSTRPGVMCAHREPAYVREPWACAPDGDRSRAHADLACSEQVQDQGLVLPLFHHLTDEEQQRVAEALRDALEA